MAILTVQQIGDGRDDEAISRNAAIRTIVCPYGVRRDRLVKSLAEIDDIESAYDLSEEQTKIEVVFNSERTLEAVSELLYSAPLMKHRIPINLAAFNDSGEIEKVTIPQVIRERAERRLKAHDGNRTEVLKEFCAVASLKGPK